MIWSYHFSNESLKGKIKNWILDLSFVSEVINKAYKDGGIASFPLAQKDVLATMADDLDTKAEELAQNKLNDLLSSVDLKFVVTLDKARGVLKIGGESVDEGRLSNLHAEAEFFLQSDLWNLIYNSPKRLAEKAMFADDGKLEAQLLKGRAMMYLLDTQKNIVEVFKGFSKK